MGQFAPIALNQRLLGGDFGARDLVAKITQKRTEKPTSAVELDPCRVFLAIEEASFNGGLLLVGKLLDFELEGKPIGNVKFDMLDAILGHGLSSTEFQEWRRQPRTPRRNKNHPMRPLNRPMRPSRQMPPGGDLPLARGVIPARVGAFEDPSIQLLRQQNVAPRGGIQEGARRNILNLYEQPLGSSHSNQNKTPTKPGAAASGNLTSPESLRRMRIMRFDAGRGSIDLVHGSEARHLGDHHRKAQGVDVDSAENNGIGGKKRKLEYSLAEVTQAKVPGARGRQIIREMMEWDSSQGSQSNVTIKKKKQDGGQSKSAAGRGSLPRISTPQVHGSGNGTADDPFEIV